MGCVFARRKTTCRLFGKAQGDGLSLCKAQGDGLSLYKASLLFSLQKVDCEADIYNIKEAGESYILIFILFIYRKDTFNVDC